MYYERYRGGRLVAQPYLSRALRHTPYAIDFDDLNPMTIRLLATLDALELIKQKVDEYKQFVALASRGITRPFASRTIERVMHSTAPEVQGLGAKVSSLPNSAKEEKGDLEYKWIGVYKALHSFYSNGGACLDRLGWELNRVYAIGIKPLTVDFRSVWNYKDLNIITPNVNELLSNENANIAKEFMAYRNRELHDGVIRVEAHGTEIFLPSGFEGTEPKRHTAELEGLCKRHFDAIEGLIGNAYRMMKEEFETTGTLPLRGQPNDR